MDRQRFEDLAAAFGGEISRWPAIEQPAARSLMTIHPVWAQEVLTQARTLDQVLDEWRPEEVAYTLREAVIAQAPRALRRARQLTWLVGVTAGLGLAGASVAGLVVGVALAVHSSQAQIGFPDQMSPDESIAVDMSEFSA